MFPLSPSFLKCVAAGALLALTAVSTPASAEELAQNLGPVGPHEAMITTVGSKRVIAFFVPGNGNCHVQAVIWQANDMEATTAAGFRISLRAGQTASIDSPDNNRSVSNAVTTLRALPPSIPSTALRLTTIE